MFHLELFILVVLEWFFVIWKWGRESIKSCWYQKEWICANPSAKQTILLFFRFSYSLFLSVFNLVFILVFLFQTNSLCFQHSAYVDIIFCHTLTKPFFVMCFAFAFAFGFFLFLFTLEYTNIGSANPWDEWMNQ